MAFQNVATKAFRINGRPEIWAWNGISWKGKVAALATVDLVSSPGCTVQDSQCHREAGRMAPAFNFVCTKWFSLN